MTAMLEKLYEVCQDNFFEEIQMNGNTLKCTICSFNDRYRLEAVSGNGGIELSLSDCQVLTLTPPVRKFLLNHGITDYPLRCSVRFADEMQDALDSLQTVADDLFGFCHDLAEERHTLESAEEALSSNFALRDTPQESSQLDCPAACMMRNKTVFWQLSAGKDFRDLVWCSGRFSGMDLSPQVFIHTDCNPDFNLDTPGKVFEDRFKTVILKKESEFDRMSVPQNEFSPLKSEESGRVVLYQAELFCRGVLKMKVPLIYAVCGDAWFAAEFLVPNRIAVDIVCRPDSSPEDCSDAWISRVLRILRTQHFLSDSSPGNQNSDEHFLQRYPQLGGVHAELIPCTVNPEPFPGHDRLTVYQVR